MGEFKDFLDAFEDLQSEGTKALRSVAKYGVGSSISRKANDGTCYFPLVADIGVPVDHAIVIGRALERTFASFVLTTLTMNPYMELDANGEISAADFVAKFHQNMHMTSGKSRGLSAAGLVAAADAFVDEGYEFASLCDKYNLDYKSIVLEGANQVLSEVAFHIYQGVYSQNANRKCSRLNFSVMEEINPSVLNHTGNPRALMEGPDGDLFRAVAQQTRNSSSGSGSPPPPPAADAAGAQASRGAAGTVGGSGSGGSSGTGGGQSGDPIRKRGDNYILGKGGQGGQGGRGGQGGAGGRGGYAVAKGGNAQAKGGNVNNNNTVNVYSGNRKGNVGRSPMKHIVEAEYKKANDLVPTMLHVRVFPTSNDNQGELPEPIDFLLGVKVTIHPVDSDVMVDEIARGINGEDAIFSFIKWYTGEIKFFRDFIFAIDEQKYDAKNMSKTSHSWFVASKRRKNVAKIQSKLLKLNPLSPIMSVLVSTDTLESLKQGYGFDLKQYPKLINNIMSSYYLLSFVTYDGSTQRVDLSIDGAPENQVLTISTMEREATNQDRQFREMMKALGRSY